MKRDSRSTQRARILGLLQAANGGWVPLPQIADCAAQYKARIFELRREGFKIRNRTKEVDGVRHSWFRLETETPASRPVSPPPSPVLKHSYLGTVPMSATNPGTLLLFAESRLFEQ
jgi:hypothetical protein